MTLVKAWALKKEQKEKKTEGSFLLAAKLMNASVWILDKKEVVLFQQVLWPNDLMRTEIEIEIETDRLLILPPNADPFWILRRSQQIM